MPREGRNTHRIEKLSLKLPNASDTSGNIGQKGLSGSPVSKGRGKMGKDNLKKLVNAPRSRKEQMLLAKMMQNYTKAKPSSRPKLTTGSDSQSDLDSPIYVEDLPDDVQMQIAQLLEEEAEDNAGDSDPGIMDISELDNNKPRSVNDIGDDLEMAMIQEDDSAGTIDPRYQDDSDYVQVIESEDPEPEEIFVDGSATSDHEQRQTASTQNKVSNCNDHDADSNHKLFGSHHEQRQTASTQNKVSNCNDHDADSNHKLFGSHHEQRQTASTQNKISNCNDHDDK